MNERAWAAAAVLVLAVVGVGCGDDDAAPPADARPTTSTTEAAAPDDTDAPSGDAVAQESGGGPGTENIGVSERVTIRVLDEDGDVVAGAGR